MAMSTGEHVSEQNEPRALHFPSAAEVPESKRHLELRTLLYQLLAPAFADRAAVGCDQFVYWDPTDPAECLAPDAFVHFGEPDSLFRSWKTWERGTLDVAVEIVGESEDSDRDVEAKVARYQRLGVTELVRFDPQATEQALRVWDRIGQELVERSLTALTAQSRCLPGYWVVVEDAKVGPALRLSRDAGATDLYLTEAEANARRVRELEALLQQRG
jgi:hypothetical protein